MKMSINFDNPVIPCEQILCFKIDDLDNFYIESSEVERLNMFFMLLSTYHYCIENEDSIKVAHICYLMSYYLFEPLTPPGSEPLALYYGRQAVMLNPQKEYYEWLSIVQMGH